MDGHHKRAVGMYLQESSRAVEGRMSWTSLVHGVTGCWTDSTAHDNDKHAPQDRHPFCGQALWAVVLGTEGV